MKTTSIQKIIFTFVLASIFCFQQGNAQTKKTKGTASKGSAKSAGVLNTWTVLSMQPAGKGSDYIKVTFTASNTVYKLSPKANPAFAKRLKESMDKHTPVYIKRTSEGSDMIQSVVVPGVPGQKKKKK